MMSAMRDLPPMDMLDMIPFKDKFVNESMADPNVFNDSVINLMSHRKRKLREKFRMALREGNPIKNYHAFAHHFRNNKPSMWIYFKTNDDNSAKKNNMHSEMH